MVDRGPAERDPPDLPGLPVQPDLAGQLVSPAPLLLDRQDQLERLVQPELQVKTVKTESQDLPELQDKTVRMVRMESLVLQDLQVRADLQDFKDLPAPPDLQVRMVMTASLVLPERPDFRDLQVFRDLQDFLGKMDRMGKMV